MNMKSLLNIIEMVELIPTDNVKRRNDCQWSQTNIDNNRFDSTSFTDGPWCYLCVYVDSENSLKYQVHIKSPTSILKLRQALR